jgi:hypothetical protein
VLALGLMRPCQAESAQSGESTARPISLYVTVEEDGGLVRGLTAQTFRLLEEDRPRPFELQAPENPSSTYCWWNTA